MINSILDLWDQTRIVIFMD